MIDNSPREKQGNQQDKGENGKQLTQSLLLVLEEYEEDAKVR